MPAANKDESKTGAEAQPQARSSAGPKRQGSLVWKPGNHFTVRSLTKQDWKRVGVENGKDVTWNSANKHTVPASELDFLDDEQFDNFILGDGDFRYIQE